MGSVTFFWLGALVGFLIGRVWERAGRPIAAVRIDSPEWSELPSGWSREVQGLTIYAMTQGGAAYWWVSRSGRTIVEGPAVTLDLAKIEAEREAHELSR